MTILTFPSNPNLGDVYTGSNGINYTWDGYKWVINQNITVAPPVPPINPTPSPPAPPPVVTVYDPLLNLSFPANPTVGQTYVVPDTGVIYQYDGIKWATLNSVVVQNTVTGVSNSNTQSVSTYKLPVATQTTLGGVIIGAGITDNNGTISVDTNTLVTDVIAQASATIISEVEAAVVIPATSSALGMVKIGANIHEEQDGTISVPAATNTTLGVVQAGTNVTIDGTGAINVPYGAGINTLESIPNVNPTGITAGSLLVYNQTASRWDVTTNLTQENWDSGQY